MDKLRPMVRTHLLFATGEDAMYRTLSMYLLAQYFLYRRGQKRDWDFEKLTEIYEEIHVVNKSFSQRVSGTTLQDAIINAVVVLDSTAELTNISLRTKHLDKIEHLYHAYLDSESSKQT